MNAGAGGSTGGASGGAGGAKPGGGGCGCRLGDQRGGAWSLLIALLLLRKRRHPSARRE
jgi:MYXO-CTERM domain-containing protein